MAISGVVGLCVGSSLSYFLRPKFRWIDPVICGGGLIPSSILILTCLVIMYNDVEMAYVTMFFGQVFLNMLWAVAVDMMLVSADNALKTNLTHLKEFIPCVQSMFNINFCLDTFYIVYIILT